MPPDPVTAIIPSRPSIRIEGADAPNLTSGLRELLIAEDTEGLYRCEAEFENWGDAGDMVGYLHFTRRDLEFGKDFAVSLGDTRLFDGRISSLGAGFPSGSAPVFRIAAEDRMQDLRMTRRTRMFEDARIADVAQRIASDHGLTAHVDVDASEARTFAQLDQSDLSFLRERCRIIGAEVWMDGTSLHVVKRVSRNAPRATLTYAGSLLELDVTADLANQCTKLTVGGWDVADKNAVRHETSDSILQAETQQEETGASILRRAFGDRHARLADANATSEAAARERAESMYRATARRFVVANGVASGSQLLRVGARVRLEGIGAVFGGEYYVSSLRHRFDNTAGFCTEFTAERAWIRNP